MTFLVVQGWKLYVFNAGCAGLIPGLGNKIPHAMWYSKKKKKNRENISQNTLKNLRKEIWWTRKQKYRTKTHEVERWKQILGTK